MQRVNGLGALLGAGVLVGCLIASTAARADDDWRYDRRADVRADLRQIHRDEDRLADLQVRLDGQERSHDWRGARDTRRDMDHVRDRLARERRDLHNDERHHG